MNAGELVGLAERVEAAAGADRELDAAIALTQGWQSFPGDNWIGPNAEICVPAYTASLDAAMTLVGERYWTLGNAADGKHDGRFHARIGLAYNVDHSVKPLWHARAVTPALALTAAALAALAQEQANG